MRLVRQVAGMVVVLVTTLPLSRAVAAEPSPLNVRRSERLLVVAPHPDDETLGAGGLVQRVLERGGNVRIVLVTAGDGYVEAVVHETGRPRPRPAQYVAYGKRRLTEARAAIHDLGQKGVRLEFLGFPDGGLQRLLNIHWQSSHPERSQTTEASDPPYDDALEPDVPYDGADLRRELVRLMRETDPTIVALPDPLDKHPDHRAAGLFTLLAVDDWASEGAKPANTIPRLLTYLVHWPAWPPGWDAERPAQRAADGMLQLPQNFPRREPPSVVLRLSDKERARKYAALAKYASQQEAMSAFLAAFVRRTEPFAGLPASELPQLGHMIERRTQRGKAPGRP